jgi:ABC-type multidrug transport system ATPase subunit
VFLDEPTSGMDSLTAMKVIEVVAKLAKRGRTVVAVIHQPNSQIFQMFDQLMLLSLGNIIYFVRI